MRILSLIVVLLTLAFSFANAQVQTLNAGEEDAVNAETAVSVPTDSIVQIDSVLADSVDVDSLEISQVAAYYDSIRIAKADMERAEAERRQSILDSLVWSARKQDAAASGRATLLRLWNQQHPLKVSRRGCSLPENVILPEDRRVDSLLRIIDDLPLDRRMSSGQPSFRLPMLPEFFIPSHLQRFRPSSNLLIKRQLEYGDERLEQTYRYYSQHLGRTRMMRFDLDVPVDRVTLSSEAGLLGLKLDVAKAQDLRVETLSKSLAYTDKWHRKGNSSFQMSQTALSDNWYKGGDNNMSIASDNKLVISRYDKDKKTTFETTLRLQLSGYYTTADTIHQMRVSDNTFRVDINYGYKAWKNWYYSTTTYAKTPVFDYYNTNSRVVKSTLLSPLEWNVSVGMDYKKSWNKNKSSFSLLLAPLSYNLTYVHDSRVSETSYGVDAGKCSKNRFGSSITSKLEWRITNDLSLSSRLYYFTDYKSVQAEFENTFNFAMSRHFSSRLYLFPRFDDQKDDKIQMKEMFTFGFSTIW